MRRATKRSYPQAEAARAVRWRAYTHTHTIRTHFTHLSKLVARRSHAHKLKEMRVFEGIGLCPEHTRACKMLLCIDATDAYGRPARLVARIIQGALTEASVKARLRWCCQVERSPPPPFRDVYKINASSGKAGQCNVVTNRKSRVFCIIEQKVNPDCRFPRTHHMI